MICGVVYMILQALGPIVFGLKLHCSHHPPAVNTAIRPGAGKCHVTPYKKCIHPKSYSEHFENSPSATSFDHLNARAHDLVMLSRTVRQMS